MLQVNGTDGPGFDFVDGVLQGEGVDHQTELGRQVQERGVLLDALRVDGVGGHGVKLLLVGWTMGRAEGEPTDWK